MSYVIKLIITSFRIIVDELLDVMTVVVFSVISLLGRHFFEYVLLRPRTFS